MIAHNSDSGAFTTAVTLSTVAEVQWTNIRNKVVELMRKFDMKFPSDSNSKFSASKWHLVVDVACDLLSQSYSRKALIVASGLKDKEYHDQLKLVKVALNIKTQKVSVFDMLAAHFGSNWRANVLDLLTKYKLTSKGSLSTTISTEYEFQDALVAAAYFTILKKQKISVDKSRILAMTEINQKEFNTYIDLLHKFLNHSNSSTKPTTQSKQENIINKGITTNNNDNNKFTENTVPPLKRNMIDLSDYLYSKRSRCTKTHSSTITTTTTDSLSVVPTKNEMKDQLTKSVNDTIILSKTLSTCTSIITDMTNAPSSLLHHKNNNENDKENITPQNNTSKIHIQKASSSIDSNQNNMCIRGTSLETDSKDSIQGSNIQNIYTHTKMIGLSRGQKALSISRSRMTPQSTLTNTGSFSSSSSSSSEWVSSDINIHKSSHHSDLVNHTHTSTQMNEKRSHTTTTPTSTITTISAATIKKDPREDYKKFKEKLLFQRKEKTNIDNTTNI